MPKIDQLVRMNDLKCQHTDLGIVLRVYELVDPQHDLASDERSREWSIVRLIAERLCHARQKVFVENESQRFWKHSLPTEQLQTRTRHEFLQRYEHG